MFKDLASCRFLSAHISVTLTLAALGLSGCQQSNVRDQATVQTSEKSLVATSESNGTPRPDEAGLAAGDVITKSERSPYSGGNRNRNGGLMYASASGPSGGRAVAVAHTRESAPEGRRTYDSVASQKFPSEYQHLYVDAGSTSGWRGDRDKPLLLAAADTDVSKTQTEDSDKSAKTAECAAFEKDIDADMGKVLKAGCEPSLAQMSALMDNPLGNVAMLFTQFDLYRMENPATGQRANKWNYMGIAQFPKAINEDWNLINRVVWNVPSMPLDQSKIDRAADAARRTVGSGNGGAVLPPSISGASPIDLFDGRTTGFGDMYYVGLFAPKKPTKLEGGGKFLWGLGFDVGLPTATEDILGTGKWSAGPSALAVYMGPKWKVGGLVQHYWDFAGDSSRGAVNMTNLQYLYYYSLDKTTSIGAGPNIIANWEQDSANVFTVPVGIGINKTVQFGKVPVRFGVEVHYSVIRPTSAVRSNWDLRFYMIPAAPSALFDWMTKPLL